MTSETDHPRQRTVAELLAEHGGDAATGRRRRRRAAGGPDDVESSGGYPHGAPTFDYAPPVTPDRRILREPVPQDEPLRRAAPSPQRRPTGFDIPRESPTDEMPRVPDSVPPDGGVASTAAPAGAEQWHRSRTDVYDDEEYEELDDEHDEIGDEFEDTVDDEQAGERPVRRRARDEEPSGVQSWGAVVAQWIIGAIGGAALWVAFRFLWRDLMVVAIFAAILVTVGLVLVVRYLLRTTDTRTTVLAVGVGLLLTVSPVILILLGK
ncbi:MAG: hypothetical protein L0H84_08075 [Pseudonocardia sp.]|nr:hypothetical protein [Pseudonocardia sp.]